MCLWNLALCRLFVAWTYNFIITNAPPPPSLGTLQTNYLIMNPARSYFKKWGQRSISMTNHRWNDILIDECEKLLKLNTNKQNQSCKFYLYPSGFFWDNQIIHRGRAVVMTSLHVQAKYRKHDARLNKHKIELKHVYIRLEILSNTYI